MNLFFRKRLYFIPVAVIFFLLAYNETFFFSYSNELTKSARHIEKHLEEIGESLNQNVARPSIINSFFNGSLTEEENTKLTDLPYSVLAYKADSLVYWNSNSVIPGIQPENYEDGYSFRRFDNGSYAVWKKKIGTGSRPNFLVVLIPVKYDYFITNDYLKSAINEDFHLKDYFEVSRDNLLNKGEAVHSPDGKTLFYLLTDISLKNAELNYFSVFFFLAGFLFLILSVNALLKLVPIRFTAVRILVPLSLLVCLYYLLSGKSILPFSFQNRNIFDPDIFASPDVASSLGNLLLQELFLIWVTLWLYYNVSFSRVKEMGAVLRGVIQFVVFSVIFFMGIYFVYAIKGLVQDSKISFTFYNPFAPDNISLIAMLCIAVLIFSFFIITHKLLRDCSPYTVKTMGWWMAMVPAILLAAFYFPLFKMGEGRWWVIISIFTIISIIHLFRLKKITDIGFIKLFALLIIFSSLSALLIQYYGNEKEVNNRLGFARKYLYERDNVTEFQLTQTQDSIPQDKFVQSFFVNPHMSYNELKDRLQKLYFGAGFERYNLKIVPYNLSGFPLKMDFEPDYGYFGNTLLRSAEMVDEGVYFISLASGNTSYIGVYPILNDNAFVGRLIVILDSKNYKAVNVYPELLLEEKNKAPRVIAGYSYAVYDDDKMIDEGGEYAYSYINEFKIKDLSANEPHFINEEHYNHMLLKENGKLIIVSDKKELFPAFLSYFTYLFIVLFILVLILLTGMAIENLLNSPRVRTSWFQRASFRSIIQFAFIMIIFSSVIIIGVIIGQFFLSQFSKYTRENLIQKLRMVDESVKFAVQHTTVGDSICGFEAKDADVILKKNIADIAGIQDMDINFYNLHGDLITSSQQTIFERNLLSKKINPKAFYNLTHNHLTLIVQEERIGNLDYLSAYQPIHNPRGELFAYLNIPYFNTSRNLNDQIGFFFASLVNILVFALIVAGFLAPFISNQIARKLSFIAEKFKLVNLSHRNELIEWNTKDELGSLVAEFNKMVLKLDESAGALARSERESAWREMAKQVAHEIKNPLTPMKLSIQHLQRAYEQNDPRAKELAQRMAVTLVEQIDNLSKIATEFSSFAKMPRPENEILNAHAILQRAVDLYKNERDANISYQPFAEKDKVNADRNQLIRVFNNLILNAIQAIPEEVHGRIEVKTANEDGCLLISIKDNGSGIDDEAAAKLFTPSFTTKTSGTGLGLAMSRNIIEMAGGSIWFKSAVGKGTTFYIKLPLEA